MLSSSSGPITGALGVAAPNPRKTSATLTARLCSVPASRTPDAPQIGSGATHFEVAEVPSCG